MSNETGFKAELLGRVLFARWVTAPTAEDVASMEMQLAEAMQRTAGPITHVVAVDARMRMPNAEERGHLNRLAHIFRRYCQTVHFVVEGDELQHSMLRLIVSGMLIATRVGRELLLVHHGAESAVEEVARRLKTDGQPLFRRARALGLLDWGEPQTLRASSW